MSDKPETLSAILAEMRDFCSGWSEDVDVTVKVGLIYGWICRIEEAARLERESLQGTIDKMRRAISQSATGNAAALREALENVERVAKYCAETPRHTPGYPTDAARADVLYSRIAELGSVARAALAAPARNCDRFQTAAEAALAFNADTKTKIGEEISPRLLAWLFAPAKGGAE